MARLFAAQPANNLPPAPNYNICPTDQVATIRSGPLGRQLVSMRWGFVPQWYKSENDGPLLINARAETLSQKPAFAEACRTRRCLIPADGFYEWTKDADDKRHPWFFHRTDDTPIAFAGIWQDWGDEPQSTCAIVTTQASRPLQTIHHRMPLILEPHDWPTWLGEEEAGAARLMVPGADDLLQFFRVHPRVNSNKASGTDLIAPLDENADVLEDFNSNQETSEAESPQQGELF